MTMRHYFLQKWAILGSIGMALAILANVSSAAEQATPPEAAKPLISTNSLERPAVVQLTSDVKKLRADLANVTEKIGAFATASARDSEAVRLAEITRSDALRSHFDVSAKRLDSIESKIAQYSSSTNEAAWRTTVVAIVAILVSLVVQWWAMKHQRDLNREAAQKEVANSYVEWQLKQLSELYGPLRALLEQSNSMYRQMNRVLERADASRFRMRDSEGGDFDNKVFEILVEGNWTRFRTVKHLAEVYNGAYGVEPYFDDVVRVGSLIAKRIRDKAGYARGSDTELVQVMGEYLAHYAVLSRLHKRAKMLQDISPISRNEECVFPTKIQELVNLGFSSINEDVMSWRGRDKNG